jgi:hypothetical protein
VGTNIFVRLKLLDMDCESSSDKVFSSAGRSCVSSSSMCLPSSLQRDSSVGWNSESPGGSFWNLYRSSLTCGFFLHVSLASLKCIRPRLMEKGCVVTCTATHLVVFRTILISHLLALIAHIPLHSRINNQFFPGRMTSQFPRELVLPAGFCIGLLRIEDLVIVILQLGMVMLDGVHHPCLVRRRHCSGGMVYISRRCPALVACAGNGP